MSTALGQSRLLNPKPSEVSCQRACPSPWGRLDPFVAGTVPERMSALVQQEWLLGVECGA